MLKGAKGVKPCYISPVEPSAVNSIPDNNAY